MLILDEPTLGLDPLARQGVYELLHILCQKGELSILLVTHDILFAARLCSRFIVLRQGRLVAEGVPWKLARSKDGYLRDLLASVYEAGAEHPAGP